MAWGARNLLPRSPRRPNGENDVDCGEFVTAWKALVEGLIDEALIDAPREPLQG